MPSLSERPRAGAFIASEAANARDAAFMAAGSGRVEAGTVLGYVQDAAAYVPLAPDANDGSEVAHAVLFARVDRGDAPVPAVVVARKCELKGALLIWPDGLSAEDRGLFVAQLAALDMAIRSSEDGTIVTPAEPPTDPETAPDAAPDVTAGTPAVSGAPITYEIVAGATSYDLRWSQDGGVTWITLAGIGASPFALSGLAAATATLVQVRGTNAAGNGPWSSSASFTTATPPPAGEPPAIVTAPVIAGVPQVGQALTVTRGVWSGNPDVVGTWYTEDAE